MVGHHFLVRFCNPETEHKAFSLQPIAKRRPEQEHDMPYAVNVWSLFVNIKNVLESNCVSFTETYLSLYKIMKLLVKYFIFLFI